MEAFLAKTDLSPLNGSDINNYFHQTAEWLLQQAVLVIRGQNHRLREIEFYFTSDNHQDPFTHCHPLQSTFGTWYFHRMNATTGSYKGGTFKGLDITVGNKNCAGGFLIRSIEKIETNEIICGPSLCVDYIIQQNNSENIDLFVKTKLQENLSVFSSTQNFLTLKNGDQVKLGKKQIIFTGRIGLYFTKKSVSLEQQQKFIFKLYRAVSDTYQLNKGKSLAVVSLLENNKSVDEIKCITHSGNKVIEKYLNCFNKGRNENPSNYLGNKWSDAELCECYGAVTKKFPNYNSDLEIKTKEDKLSIPLEETMKDIIVPLATKKNSEKIDSRSTRYQNEVIVSSNGGVKRMRFF